MIEDIAKQAAELIQRAVDAVKSVFTRLRGRGRSRAGPSPVDACANRAVRTRHGSLGANPEVAMRSSLAHPLTLAVAASRAGAGPRAKPPIPTM